jgi:type I restriction enzyme S subunit
MAYEAKIREYKDFLFSLINSRSFSEYMCANVTGSTGSRQRTIPRTTLEYEFIMPDETTVLDFCKLVSPIYDLISSNQKEIQQWNKTRAVLNDKLLSQKLELLRSSQRCFYLH